MGCMQCRKQKEQSTKSKTLDDTLSWLDSDCSIEDENILRMMDQELLKLRQHKNEEKSGVQKQPQQSENQQIINDEPQFLQQHISEQNSNEYDDRQYDDHQYHENAIQQDSNEINSSKKIKSLIEKRNEKSLKKSLQKLKRSKSQGELPDVFDPFNEDLDEKIKSLIEKRNEISLEKSLEKSIEKLKRSRSYGELPDDGLPPFNQILYQVYQEYNFFEVREQNAIQTKIFSVQQQQKVMSKSNSKDDIIVEDDNSVQSEAEEIVPTCFCCNKQCNKAFQLNCLHFYNQKCLIDLVVKQINQSKNFLTCLCLKQIKNETIAQIQSLAQISHEEKEKIEQFYQNGY